MKLASSLSILTLAVSALAADAAITMTKASADFTNVYDGNAIYNGTSFINGWNNTAGGVATPTLTGTSLAIATPGNNGWIDLVAGDFTGIASNQSYTVEATISLAVGQAFVIWSDPAATDGTIVYAHGGGLGSSAAGTQYGTSSNVGTHTYRLAYDASGASNVFSLWRDNVLVEDASIAPSNPAGGPRLIVGDCCSSFATTGFTVENISFDTGGAFAPVPEPGSMALLGFGSLALVLRRRR